MFDIFKKLAPNNGIKQGKIEYIIAGLGNPGKKYENTRHNAGFMAIDYIAEKCDIKINKLKFKSLCGEVFISSKRVLLLKPQTFMNNSGQSVVEAMNFYKVPAENVIVIFDDISIDPGNIRIRKKGSDGGHNGMKNIIYLLGKDNSPRIKIGIGAKPNPQWDLADWVLSKFSPEDMRDISKAIGNTFGAVELMVSGDIQEAMNKYN